MIEKKLSNATPLDDENVVLRRSDNKELANVSLSNLNEVGEKHFLNKTQITNCILEAPNGVATYSGNTITVKQGLKVLMPNGRNADGSLKNIEYTVPNGSAYNVSTTTTSNAFIIVNNPVSEGEKNVYIWWDKAVFIQEEEPTNLSSVLQNSPIIWYQPSKNIWWYLKRNATTPYDWVDSGGLCPIGYFDKGGTTTIQSLTSYQPVELLKRTDKAQITSWSFPSSKYINLTLGAYGSTYTAPADGWFSFRSDNRTTSDSRLYIYAYNSINGMSDGCSLDSASTGQDMFFNLPVLKGQTIGVYHNLPSAGSSEIRNFNFIYAQGVTND